MISKIDEQGNTHWTCLGLHGTCKQVNTYHVSHEKMQWLNEHEIVMPPCSACGAIMTIRVHTDEELTPPVITHDENTGKIVQVAPADHPKFSGNLWFVEKDVVRHPLPHPTLAHLSEGQIKELQASIKNQAPDAPLDWMLTETTREIIHRVFQHPAVAVHRQLADVMRQNGKVYSEPAS
jgi:hypothetical protein